MNRNFMTQLNKLAQMIDELDVYKTASMNPDTLSSVDYEVKKVTDDKFELSVHVKANFPLDSLSKISDLSDKGDEIQNQIEDCLKQLSSDCKIKEFKALVEAGNLMGHFVYELTLESDEDLESKLEDCFGKAVTKKTASIYDVSRLYKNKYASTMFSVDMSNYTAGKPQYVGETLFQALFTLYKATETLFKAVETSNGETKAATVPLEKIDISTTTARTHMGKIGLNANQLMIMAYEGSVTPGEVKRRLDNIRKNFKTVSEIVRGFNDPLSFTDSKDIGAGMAAFRKLSPTLDAFDRVLTAAEKALSTFKPKPVYKAPAPAKPAPAKPAAKPERTFAPTMADTYLSYLQQGIAPEDVAANVQSSDEVDAFRTALEEYSGSPVPEEQVQALIGS